MVESICAYRASGMMMTMCCRGLPWEVSVDCVQFCLVNLQLRSNLDKHRERTQGKVSPSTEGSFRGLWFVEIE